MDGNHSSKKGFTLVELVIVLVISLAVISTVIPLLVMIIKETQRNDLQVRSALDVDSARLIADRWFSNCLTSDYVFQVSEDGFSVKATPVDPDAGLEEHEMSFSNYVLYVDGSVCFRFDMVTSVKFSKTDGVVKVEVETEKDWREVFLYAEGGQNGP